MPAGRWVKIKRILIVEDTPDLGRLLVAAIATISSEIKAEVMPSAEEAFLEMVRQPADLLVTDIRLPGMTGVELLKKVHTKYPQTRIIVMTGLPDPTYRAETLKAGADVFFSKPLEMGDFLESISRLLAIGNEGKSTLLQTDVHPPARQISDVLSGLHTRLGASGVFILNESGTIICQMGGNPSPQFDEKWSIPLAAAAKVAGDLAHLVSETHIEGVMVFRGSELDLVIAPLRSHLLVVTMPTSKRGMRLAAALEEALGAQEELQGILGEMGIKVSVAQIELTDTSETVSPASPSRKPAEQIPPVETGNETAALQEFSDMLLNAENGILESDPESFWEQIQHQDADIPENSDVLSFDQAKKLGILPDLDQKLSNT